jgi:calcineurin-like phosphoesterase family protein
MYFISDTHFHHSKVIDYSRRPYSSVEEMNQSLIDNWNKIVKPNDEIYHLGDFGFGNANSLQKIINSLNGKKHLILGNHDTNTRDVFNTNFFSSVQNYKEIKINKQLLVLFHYGQRVWNKSHYGSIHLYGHSHGTLPPHGRSVDVGVDCKEITNEYRPVHLNEILSYMNNKEVVISDKHEIRK